MVPLNDQCDTFLMTQELPVPKVAVMSTPQSVQRRETRPGNVQASLNLGHHPLTLFLLYFLTWKKETGLHFGEVTEPTVHDLLLKYFGMLVSISQVPFTGKWTNYCHLTATTPLPQRHLHVLEWELAIRLLLLMALLFRSPLNVQCRGFFQKLLSHNIIPR